MNRKLLFLLCATALLTCSVVNASVVITATELNNGTVVFSTVGGTLNTDAWTYVSDASIATVIDPSNGLIQMATGTIDYYDSPDNFVAPGPFGVGVQATADSILGPFNLDVGIDPGAKQLIVPQNYTSNGPIPGGQMVFTGTYATLGLTPGTYTWSWGTGEGADSLTLDITTGAVPEPASIAVWSIIGLAGTVVSTFRKRRRR